MQLRTEQLTFTYHASSALAARALSGVTLEIPDGSFFGIIGHTGSGKSTFVTHLNGLNDVQSGTVTAGEITLYNVKERKRAVKALKKRRKSLSEEEYEKEAALLPCDPKKMKRDRALVCEKVGMVFQYPEYQLFAETVEEDISFAIRNFAKKHKKDPSFVFPDEEEIAAQVRTAMDYVGLDYETYRKKSPFDLSGGQKRRVAIAGVLCYKPEVLVLDEPVAGLDPEGKKQLFSLLHSLHGTVCKTVVIVSHDMDDVAENCTHVAVFDHGKVTLSGSTAEVFSHADYLLSTGLDVPLTVYLAEELKKAGVEVAQDYTKRDFIERVAAALKARGGGPRA